MNGSSEGSIFSCIKHEEAPAQAGGAPQPHAMPSAPQPAPPQDRRQYEEVCVRLRDLESRLKKAEEREAALAAALEGARAELKAVSARAEVLAQRPAPPAAEIVRSPDAAGEAARTAAAALKAAGGAAAEVSRLREELAARGEPAGQAAHSLSVSLGLVEDRIRNLELGLAEELKARFSAFDTALMDASRKAGLAQEAAAAAGRRVERSEERLARLQYLESRVESNEGKLGKIYDLEALAQALKVSVEGMEKGFEEAMRASALTAAENKKFNSDFEGLSRQVRQLSALFNQMRTELAFLLPKRESPGEAR